MEKHFQIVQQQIVGLELLLLTQYKACKILHKTIIELSIRFRN